MNDNKVMIKLFIKPSIDDIKMLFDKFTFFTPSFMCSVLGTKNKFKKYKESDFFSYIEKEIFEEKQDFIIKDKDNSISLYKNINTNQNTLFTCYLNKKNYRENETEIIKVINNVMSSIGIVGKIEDLDDNFWQNAEQIEIYSLYEKDISKLSIIDSPNFAGEKIVDINKFPGSETIINGLWFGATWKMWFNSPYYEFVNEIKIKDFNLGFSNEFITNSCVCITLYENLDDYNFEENRQKQWAFKNAIDYDEVVNKMKNSKTSVNIDPEVEINEGKFEHGGIKLISAYFDEKQDAVPKSKAKTVRMAEYDAAGSIVWEDERIVDVTSNKKHKEKNDFER